MENTRNYNNMSNEERLERARNNSVKSRNSDLMEVNYKNEKYRISASRLKKAVVTAFLVTAIASTAVGIGLTKGVENIQDDSIVYETMAEYNDIVTSNTYRTTDNQGHWYDTDGIARDILQEDDKSLAVYSVYNRLRCDNSEIRNQHMDDIIRYMGNFVENNSDNYQGIMKYENFNDYLGKNGFVDKNGNPSTEVYKNKMKEYILAKDAMEKATIGENSNAINPSGFSK